MVKWLNGKIIKISNCSKAGKMMSDISIFKMEGPSAKKLIGSSIELENSF
jgi:hypothetical protein